MPIYEKAPEEVQAVCQSSTATAAKATLQPMPADEYFSDADYIRSSMIRDFLDSPRLFEGKYITGTVDDKPTAAMDFGTACHTAILADRPLSEVVLEIPASVLSKSGSRAGGAWLDFAQDNAGKVLLKAGEYNACLKVRDCVLAHPLARLYLEAPGKCEHAITWRDSESDLACRARPDKVLDKLPIVIDLKTSAESGVRWFTNRVIDGGLDLQCAHYCDGAQQVRGEPHAWAWIVAPTSPPYMPVRVFGIDDKRFDWACQRRHKALAEIVERTASGDWSDPGEQELLSLNFPQWSYS